MANTSRNPRQHDAAEGRYTSPAVRRVLRTAARLAVVFALSSGLYRADAQTSYVGLGLNLYQVQDRYQDPDPSPYDPSTSLAGLVQAGVAVTDALSVRASIDSTIILFLDTTFAVDVLYRVPIQERLSLYAGAGPDFTVRRSFAVVSSRRSTFGLHATFGGEYRFDYGVGVFAEARPLLLDSLGQPLLVELRSGVNVHF